MARFNPCNVMVGTFQTVLLFLSCDAKPYNTTSEIWSKKAFPCPLNEVRDMVHDIRRLQMLVCRVRGPYTKDSGMSAMSLLNTPTNPPTDIPTKLVEDHCHSPSTRTPERLHRWVYWNVCCVDLRFTLGSGIWTKQKWRRAIVDLGKRKPTE